MTSKKDLVLDTDMISSFVWVNRVDIILRLYSPNIILLNIVENELSKVPHLINRIKIYVIKKEIKFIKLDLFSKEGIEYVRLKINNWNIGQGEAAAMAYCRYNNCILGSNNYIDIINYCQKYKIDIITTENIMVEAYKNNLIDKNEGNRIWKEMISKKRKLPYKTFLEALKKQK